MVQIFLQSFTRQDLVFEYGFFMDNVSFHNQNFKTVAKGQRYIDLSPFVISENNIEKWWPAGYGKQYIYTAFVSPDILFTDSYFFVHLLHHFFIIRQLKLS